MNKILRIMMVFVVIILAGCINEKDKNKDKYLKPEKPVIVGLAKTENVYQDIVFSISGASDCIIYLTLDNGKTWKTCENQEKVTISEEGTYNIIAMQKNNKGLSSEMTETYTVIIDKKQPNTPTIKYEIVTNGAVFYVEKEPGYKIKYWNQKEGVWKEYTNPVETYGEEWETNGGIYFAAVNINAAGNTSDKMEITVDKKLIRNDLSLPSVIKLGECVNFSLYVNSSEKVKWSSENKEIAEIDETGMITAKGLGTVRITVETDKGIRSKLIAVIKEYDEFYKDIESIPYEKRQVYIDTIFDTIKENVTFPITKNNIVTFAARGNYKKILVYGDMTPSWDNKNTGIVMKNIEGTDLYYTSTILPEDSYMEYKFYDGSVSFIDELNKRSVPSSSGGNSLFWMPKYAEHNEIVNNANISHGVFTSYEDSCSYYTSSGAKENGMRKYYIYIPAGYDASKSYRVIYFHDGYNFATRAYAVNILDYMIANGEIDPVIGVFVDPIDRNADYILSNKDHFADYIANDIVNKIDSQYSTIKSPDGRVVVGASNGAVISTYIAYRHKDKFKYILAYSGAYDIAFSTYYGEDYGNNLDTVNWPVKIMMFCGNYDSLKYSNERFYNQVKENNSIIGIEYKTYNSGHKYSFWGSTLREGLIYLVGKQ